MNQTPITLPSFAKINWSLQVLGKRSDGYHELKTILQTISLHDDLHFAPTEDGAIVLGCDDESIPTDERNLIVRAAYGLKDVFRVRGGARIRLEKRIPVGGGLGGGSSNAAVALLALAQLWKIDISPSQLTEIASDLGADVPFFLIGGTALGEGIGTTLSPLQDHASEPLIVITPKAFVSTAHAYGALNSRSLTRTNPTPILSSSPAVENFQELTLKQVREDLNNDFESVIFDMEPEIRRVKEALVRSGAKDALLAGSGSSVFGIFSSRDAQKAALKEIELEAGWRMFSCDTLSRTDYVRALTVGEVSLLRSFNF